MKKFKESSYRDRDFMEALVDVCKRHGMSLAHEDTQGGFIIEKYNEKNIEWLKHAMVRVEEKPVSGKCVAKGTEVLMKDGTFKKVEDISTKNNKIHGYSGDIELNKVIMPKGFDPSI